MGRRSAVASTPQEAARLADRDLAGQIHGARVRLGMGGNSVIRSGLRKRILMLEREAARREGDG